jgi:hypothetical protein
VHYLLEDPAVVRSLAGRAWTPHRSQPLVEQYAQRAGAGAIPQPAGAAEDSCDVHQGCANLWNGRAETYWPQTAPEGTPLHLTPSAGDRDDENARRHQRDARATSGGHAKPLHSWERHGEGCAPKIGQTVTAPLGKRFRACARSSALAATGWRSWRARGRQACRRRRSRRAAHSFCGLGGDD